MLNISFYSTSYSLSTCLLSHLTKFRIFPSDLQSENLAIITKGRVFERCFDSLNLIVSFITVAISKQNSALHPGLPPDQGSVMLPVKLLSFVSLQPCLPVYLPALLADMVLHTEN